ncbi:MAG: extensin family protein [Polyangiaceae bacterium]
MLSRRLSAALALALSLVACSADDGGGGGGGASGTGLRRAAAARARAVARAVARAGSGGAAGTGATGGAAGTVATGGAAGSGGSGALTGTCLEKLDQLGVGYTNTTAKGVVDAIHLTGKLNDVTFAATDTDKVMGDPIACEFVLHLWKLADVLKAHGIHKIGTLGSYCYRCCCYWSAENFCRGPNDPEPDCTQAPWNGYSNHSWGRALDIRWFYKDTGEVYDVNDPAEFVQWSNSSETCTSALAAQTGISKELYSIACDLSVQQVFGTILTPNYNSAHRNHFHCDIGQSGEPSTFIVKSSQASVDVGPGDD